MRISSRAFPRQPYHIPPPPRHITCSTSTLLRLTPRVSCGARAPQRLRPRPPARRLLQPVVRRPAKFAALGLGREPTRLDDTWPRPCYTIFQTNPTTPRSQGAPRLRRPPPSASQ